MHENTSAATKISVYTEYIWLILSTTGIYLIEFPTPCTKLGGLLLQVIFGKRELPSSQENTEAISPKYRLGIGLL